MPLILPGETMHRQGNLFNPFGSTHATQPELFAREDLSTTLHCETCGEYLVRTPSDYLTCPKGCGKLREAAAQDAEASGSWFEELP